MAVNLLLLAVGLFMLFVTAASAFIVGAVVYYSSKWSLRAWQVVREFRDWKDLDVSSGNPNRADSPVDCDHPLGD